MSTLSEIDSAAKALPIEQQRELLISIASRLRAHPGALPDPRQFPKDNILRWVEQDEADMQRFHQKQ
jgi:hypothetical protein